MIATPGPSAGARRAGAAAVLIALAMLASSRVAVAQTGVPNIPVWSYPGAWHPGAGADTITPRSRTITVRWLRDPVAEARPDFGGYRIYRGTNIGGICDTASMVLVRRFSKQVGDTLFSWHFPPISVGMPESQRIATFIDPDSAGRYVKVRRPPNDPCRPRCYDSILVLVPPPGPHDGFRTWHSVTYEALNTTFNDYLDLFVPGPVGEQSTTDMGRDPVAIAAGDLDGDGLADLVTADETGGTVSIRPGRRAARCANAGFGPRRELSVGQGPRSLAIGDLDQDGMQDLVVANAGSSSISVFLNTGGGVLAAAPTLPLGGTPVALGLADLNGDGRLDLAVTETTGPSVLIFLGGADGTFASAPAIPVSVVPSAMVLGDVNDDRRVDVAVASAVSGAVVWRLGNNDGTFGPEGMSPTGAGARAVAIADLDGDVKSELIVANGSENTVSVLPGNGDGTFGLPTQFGAGVAPASVVAIDLDADARLDLAVADAGDGSVSFLRNGGALDFSSRTNRGLAGRPVALVAGDFNREGLFDLAVADSSADSLKVIFGSSNLNHKAANVSNDVGDPTTAPGDPAQGFFAHAVEPTGGETQNLARVGVVPNPYRAVEAWDPAGAHEVHFINLPSEARIRIYTVAGDLVRDLRHSIVDPAVDPSQPWDQLRDFERWDLRNESGREVSSGIYIYRVEAGNFSHQSRLIIIR